MDSETSWRHAQTSSSFVSSWFLKLEYADYKVLDSADRNINYGAGLECDDDIVRGWWLPDRASPGRCNSQSSALLNGKDPSVADGVVISSSANTLFIDSWAFLFKSVFTKNCCFCAIINLQKKKSCSLFKHNKRAVSHLLQLIIFSL